MKKSKFEDRLKNMSECRFLDSIVVHMDTLESVVLWNEDHSNVLDSASMVELTKTIVSHANHKG